MAKFCPMFSGSSGNCTYIGNGNSGILIDAGASATRIKKALTERNIDVCSIKAVFVTHEHTDHVSGIRVLCSNQKIPVYMTQGTMDGMINRKIDLSNVPVEILKEENYQAGMKITYFNTSHDCAQSCGYVIETSERKIAVCTDLGVISDDVRKAISGCDLVMIESNHDVMMLQNNQNYPYYLKRRIMGEQGHLSNNACATELVQLIKTGTTRIMLAHLSRENNVPALALQTSKTVLLSSGMEENSDYLINVASPCGSDMIVL